MMDFHTKGRIASRVIFGFFVFLILYLLWPTKKRLRIDRKRQIVYMYVGRKLFVTELNKLSVPLAYYFGSNTLMHYLSVWVHPHRNKRGRRNKSLFTLSPAVTFPMFIDMMRMVWLKTTIGKKSLSKRAIAGSIIPRSFIEFVNPDTDPEHIAMLEEIITSKRSWQEWLYDVAFNWLSAGIFCWRFPSQNKVEKDLQHYFAEVAPIIGEHSFYTLKDISPFIQHRAALPYAHGDEIISCDFYHAFSKKEIRDRLNQIFKRLRHKQQNIKEQ